jgi:peroxiredoxin
MTALIVGALGAGVAEGVAAQQDFLAVGAEAPDIELTGATREGVMDEPVRLSDFRGQTVVLAFFFRARTPG